MKRSVVLVQLLVTAVCAAVGGFVAVSVGSDAVDADRGGMTAAVPMMTEAQLRVGGVSASSDLATTTITPLRILDTRVGAAALAGSKTPWGALETRTVAAAGLGTIPADAVGVVVNVTVLNATAPDTFLTLFPTGTSMPNASTINPQPGEVAFNAATVLLGGDDGTFEIYNYSGTVDVIIDVTAYMTRTLADAVDTVEGEVDDVAVDVGRLQNGEPLVPRQGVASNGAFTFPVELYEDWTNYNFADPDSLFGADIPMGRYSDAAEIEMSVAVMNYGNGAAAETCFAIHTTDDGVLEDSAFCFDGSEEVVSNGYSLATSPRIPLPSGRASVFVKVVPTEYCLRELTEEELEQNLQCSMNLKWFGFKVFDS